MKIRPLIPPTAAPVQREDIAASRAMNAIGGIEASTTGKRDACLARCASSRSNCYRRCQGRDKPTTIGGNDPGRFGGI